MSVPVKEQRDSEASWPAAGYCDVQTLHAGVLGHCSINCSYCGYATLIGRSAGPLLIPKAVNVCIYLHRSSADFDQDEDSIVRAAA